MTYTLSSVLEGIHNNKKVLEMDITNGLETVGTIKISINPEHAQALKGVETAVRKSIK